MSRTASDAQEARARARLRRLALYADRAAKDERIEASVAAVFMATADRDRAREAVGRAEEVMANAVHGLLSEGVSLRIAAELCGLTVSEIRRLIHIGKLSVASEAAQPAQFRAGAQQGRTTNK